jgi:PhzF family phenazine biosynthesis protein
MMQRAFQQVDVFTQVPLRGNPVAVVLDAEGLSTEQMQQLARWTNLSETTFVVPATHAGANYGVRIFTPGSELPFAGHPTIGTAHALLEAGRIEPAAGRLVQECKVGLVTLEVTGLGPQRWIGFTAPQATVTPLTSDEQERLRLVLGTDWDPRCTPALIDLGARWITVAMQSAKAVQQCTPNLLAMSEQDRAMRATGVTMFGPHPEGSPIAYEVRSFAPSHGVPEDPVCGSGNACVGVFLRASGRASHGSLLNAQGQCIEREGRIRLDISGERILVAGQAVTCIRGTVRLDQ